MMLKDLYQKAFSSFIHYLSKELEGCSSVLDLGCGRDSPLKYCSVPFLVGVELFKPYLEESRRQKIHNEYIWGDIRKIEFKENSFDCVVLLDVLEHLSKEEGKKLILKAEKIARKKAIIFTPNGFLPQNERDNNVFQEHKSGWTVKELKELGYIVRGINGFKPLRAEGAKIKFKPAGFFSILSDITQKATYYYPSLAFQLLGIKSMQRH